MKIGKICMLLAVLTMLWGCSSDSDDGDKLEGSSFAPVEKPSWTIDMMANDPVPTWQAPDPSKYESSMFIMVCLEEQLARYASDDDMMTVLIGDECRAKPAPLHKSDSGKCYFVLKIDGNSTDRDVSFSLCYYAAKIHHLFKLSATQTFASDITYGIDEDFVPQLIKGSSRYPVQGDLTIKLPDTAPFTPSDDDFVAVFVGDDCRGVGTVGQPFTVFLTSAGETPHVRYYSAQKGGVYTFKQSLTIAAGDSKEVTLSF
jgi:hypothetical protein